MKTIDPNKKSLMNIVQDSVGGSVKGSVWDPVKDSVKGSVGYFVEMCGWDSLTHFVWRSVANSVYDPIEDSVRNSVGCFVVNSIAKKNILIKAQTSNEKKRS